MGVDLHKPLSDTVKDTASPEQRPKCYECLEEVNYLFPDSRCWKCTRCSEEEITGEN